MEQLNVNERSKPSSSSNQLFLLSLIKQSKDICFIDGGEESCCGAAAHSPIKNQTISSFIQQQSMKLNCFCWIEERVVDFVGAARSPALH